MQLSSEVDIFSKRGSNSNWKFRQHVAARWLEGILAYDQWLKMKMSMWANTTPFCLLFVSFLKGLNSPTLFAVASSQQPSCLFLISFLGSTWSSSLLFFNPKTKAYGFICGYGPYLQSMLVPSWYGRYGFMQSMLVPILYWSGTQSVLGFMAKSWQTVQWCKTNLLSHSRRGIMRKRASAYVLWLYMLLAISSGYG